MKVQGNYIGTNAAGTSSIGGQSVGVLIAKGFQITIGGDDDDDGALDGIVRARNVISGHSGLGVLLNGTGGGGTTASTLVPGNFIGTNAAGTAAIPNAIGIRLGDNEVANSYTIGGTAAGAGNLISGNSGVGIHIGDGGAGDPASNSNVVIGNRIGTAVTGASPLPNGGHGVLVDRGSSNRIGGTNAGEDNIIAFNRGTGVFVWDGTGNRILSNSIFSNTGLGIDLNPGGVTLNDTGDVDSGANNLQNFPVRNFA